MPAIRASLHLAALLWPVSACTPSATAIAPMSTATFVAPTPTSTPLPTSAPTVEAPDSGWTRLPSGLEWRRLNLYNEQKTIIETLTILRVDQSLFQLDVGYHDAPQTLGDWQKESGALAVVNGGYFRIENDKYIPTGLTVVNGVPFGASYAGYGGMLAVYRDHAEVRSLVKEPYHAGEPLAAALQSFPMLVKPGGVLGFSAANEDNQQARRTVIGQDNNGNILLIIASRGWFTLYQMSAFLTASDLNLDTALNLDGGPSSGMILESPDESVPAYGPLPVVILVYQR